MNDPRIDALRDEQHRLRLQVDTLGMRIESLARERAEEGEPIAASYEAVPVLPPAPAFTDAPTPTPQPAPKESDPFELHLGRVWLVRIGIGMLLTGLVFLASFTYQHLVAYVTPLGRAAALFAASLALGGLGLWLEKSRETLRYYGRVLAAGGLAGGYYALYASHYVTELRWIEGGLASNLVLLAWAAVIIGVACWRRAETLGVAAVALAYYTSFLGPDPAYTHVSNLILSGAAIFLTLRYGWKSASYAALAGTYSLHAIALASAGSGHATGDLLFLSGDWLVFTLGLLSPWPRMAAWGAAERLTFLTLNNALFLLLGALTLPGSGSASFDAAFPPFAIGFGLLLAATAFLSRALRPGEAAQETAFFIQGLLVATLGWISRWHGTDGALLLGIEGALLLSGSVWRYHAPLRALSHLAALAAFFWAAIGWALDLAPSDTTPLLLMALFAGEAGCLARLRKEAEEDDWGAAHFAVLAAFLYLFWIWKRVPVDHQFWVLAASGAAVYAFQFGRPARFVNWVAMVFWGLAAALFVFVYGEAERTFWANGLALAALFALEQAAIRRVPSAFLSREGQGLWLSLALAGGALFLGDVADLRQPEWSMTLVWAGIAGTYFALGLLCRERLARWAGLVLLALALGRVLCVDVWELGTLSRILTFLGLGGLLLALGFVYNRYQETFRKWL
ncbi:Predicted membrane protein [Verrucomicrobium sp. GAS474]|uniref:DUF2339 domain-containing protein n=1 Tax=Verrucomicrobium sp. GAS474 TaxID=1882831 RepID=UPI00087DBDD7|nr:DUF2339 domain-containing protein [Verrucomicrobium sp. GAS474]SDT90042.1 Predicted membrane protein [Verrucomicrobium sp. GAS474]